MPAQSGGLPDEHHDPHDLTTMSYHRNSPRVRSALAPMGDVASAVKTGADVIGDPYFGETVCRVQQLRAIERKEAVPTCMVTQPNLPGGVGLRKAMPAIRGYVWAERNRPLSYALIAAGVLGLPMLLGYAIGKRG